MKYHYFYKITNNLNGHYYYGIHSTSNLEDGYMGSGYRLKRAYKKYGVENFTKKILKYFDSRKEASDYEAEVVNELLVEDKNCYNLINGGEKFNLSKLVTCFDTKEKKNVVITQREFLASNRYFGITKGMTLVKNNTGNALMVSVDDERLKSGELTLFWEGRKHNDSTKNKIKESIKARGGLNGKRNPHYGKCWVNRDGIDKSINKNELETFLSDGWNKGRTPNNEFIKKCTIEEVDILRKSGKSFEEIGKLKNINAYTLRDYYYKHRK